VVELKPGDNTIELEGTNQGARPQYREEETERLGPLVVRFVPKAPEPVDPPSIKLDSVVMISADNDASVAAVKVNATKPTVIDMRRARIVGRISAKVALKQAEFRVDSQPWTPLRGLVPGVMDSFNINEQVSLLPKLQTVFIRAVASRGGAEATGFASVVIDYHPKLPKLERLAVEPPDPIETYGMGAPERHEVRLTATIYGDPTPIAKAVVLVNGEPIPGKPVDVDLKKRVLASRFEIPPGKNEIGVALYNLCGDSSRFGPIPARYHRLPQVEEWTLETAGGRAFARLSGRVTSATKMLGAEIEVRHGSASADGPRRYAARLDQRGAGIWSVNAELALEQGQNHVTFRATNIDGDSPALSKRLDYVKPNEPKPDLIVDTAEGANLRRPVIPLRFHVRSSSPLTSVRVDGDGSAPTKQLSRIKIAKPVRDDDDKLVVTGVGEIDLTPGTNHFTVVAANAGGESLKRLVFSYTPPPVRAVVDKVNPLGARDAEFRAVGRADGPPRVLERLPDSRIELRGRLIWDNLDSMSQFKSKDARLQVWINGFPHGTAALGFASGELEIPFRAEVLLSKLDDNEIELRLDRSEPLDLHGEQKLLVSCSKVDPNWRLHLLVISVGTHAEEREIALRRAIESLKGQFDPENPNFKTPAFPTATHYGFNADDPRISAPQVKGKLGRIRKSINIQQNNPSNDVVIVYYEGGETIENAESYLKLRPNIEDPQNDRIALSEIQKQLSKTRGAKLFLLDVTHAPNQMPQILAQAGRWSKEDSPFGLLRFCWQQIPPPPDASLAAAIRGALLENKVTLAEVSTEVDRRSTQLRDEYPGHLYLPELTRHFHGLVLGGNR
jgi:hypothetical protein